MKAKKAAKKYGEIVEEPDDLDWAYFYDNTTLRKITNTTNISSFCKIQHLKYLAHVTRLENSSLQKQLLFSTTKKKYDETPGLKLKKSLIFLKCKSKKKCKIKLSSCPYSI